MEPLTEESHRHKSEAYRALIKARWLKLSSTGPTPDELNVVPSPEYDAGLTSYERATSWANFAIKGVIVAAGHRGTRGDLTEEQAAHMILSTYHLSLQGLWPLPHKTRKAR